MFLCRKGPFNTSFTNLLGCTGRANYAASTTKRAGRVSEIIILDTPRSTRKRKKAGNVKSELGQEHQLLLTQYASQNQAELERYLNIVKRKSEADIDEVHKFLDGLKKEYANRKLSENKIRKLEAELRRGFTADQLRAYLEHCGAYPQGKRTMKLTSLIIRNAWSITERPVHDAEEHSRAMSLGGAALHFLLAENGQLLQSWIDKYHVKIDVKKKVQSITVTGTLLHIANVEQALQAFLSTVQSKAIHVAVPDSFEVNRAITKATHTFVEKGAPGELMIYFVDSETAQVQETERYIKASLELYANGNSPLSTFVAPSEAQDLVVYRRGEPLEERGYEWKRKTGPSNGIQLPFYYINSPDPKPLKANQVRARPDYVALQPTTKLSDGRDFTDIMDSWLAAGTSTVSVTFGQLLKDTVAGVRTFNRDIPGQFHALKELTPLQVESAQNRLSITCMGETAFFEVLLPQDSTFTEEPSVPRQPSIRKRQVSKEYIEASSQVCDLEIRSNTDTDCANVQEIEAYVNQFTKDKDMPTSIKIDGQMWNVHFENVVTQSFTSSNFGAGIRLDWSMIRSPAQSIQRQELSVIGQPGVSGRALAETVCQVMQTLQVQ